ncbi:MAG TPA: SDR family NAD(P)-dependent oxidoreductase [Solirubrobacterales bacterium]|nr:SDR family NAD(P)-dependent oxidoreductase [Solirubrobacterales bacterium]
MQSVLVTGASTGIGRASTLHLDAAGWRVFAGVRKEADAESLHQACSGRLMPLMLDVTDAEQIAAAAERIGKEVGEGGLDGLVNNAGIAMPGPLEVLPIDDFRRQVEVNLTAHVAVTQAMLPAIRTARGRIVFITSIGGLMAFPMFGAYHAAKFGLEAAGDVFRRELRPWGISVSVIEPGSIDTPIWERGDRQVGALLDSASDEQKALYGKSLATYREVGKRTGARGIPAEKVASTIEHALSARRPRTRYLVGKDARGQALLARVLPDRLLDWLITRLTGL